MATGTERPIYADEVGIAFGRHGDVVLRSAFQPLYAPQQGQLRAVAVESFLRPFRDGTPIAPRPFLEALDERERTSVERLAVEMHSHNHSHLDIVGLDHVLGVSRFAPPAWLRRSAGDTVRPIASVRLVSGLTVLPAWLAGAGLPIMLGSVGDAAPDPAIIRSAKPAIVRLGGAWFRRICDSQQATRLLRTLVSGLRRDGYKVAVEGIQTRRQLAAALDVGADLLQGFLLARPELVGTAATRETIELASQLSGGGTAVPLSGEGRS